MGPSKGKLRSALLIARGEVPGASERLVLHGLAWLLLSIGLDFGSSWLMMSLHGPGFEGNAIQRSLFENPSVGTSLAWFEGQWAWFLFVGFAVAALLLVWLKEPSSDAKANGVLGRVRALSCEWAFAFTWPLAVIRISYGVGSNTAGILLPFGWYFGIAGWLGVVIFAVYVVERDALECLFPSGTQTSPWNGKEGANP